MNVLTEEQRIKLAALNTANLISSGELIESGTKFWELSLDTTLINVDMKLSQNDNVFGLISGTRIAISLGNSLYDTVQSLPLEKGEVKTLMLEVFTRTISEDVSLQDVLDMEKSNNITDNRMNGIKTAIRNRDWNTANPEGKTKSVKSLVLASFDESLLE